MLGTAQDGGYPQVGCMAECCKDAWSYPEHHRLPCALGIVHESAKKRWMIDCTPAFPQQWARLNTTSPASWGLSGIFLTHAHIGHYTGLMQLGREVWSSSRLPVYVMPRMKEFLENNAPWNQLISQGNIKLEVMTNKKPITLTDSLQITPILVPHRDELSETVGFRIDCEAYSALYISDIDHWNAQEPNIESEIVKSDIAWLDGTFYSLDEVPHRNRSQIPHPTIEESMARFAGLSQTDRNKINFFHLNHSNPLINPNAPQSRFVLDNGFQIAREMSIWPA